MSTSTDAGRDGALVRDVDEAAFAEVVIEGSKTRPVVVDFWAAWCGPCTQLSPALERAAADFAGEVDVVKVDVDANPRLAQAMRVQGIPAVKAFADGRLVSEFTGLQPPAAIQQFFAALAPSPADRLVARAAADPAEAESLYGEALEAEPDHPGASVGLADLLAGRGDVGAALDVLTRARPTPQVQQRVAALRLQGQAGDVGALRDQVAAGDATARVPLGEALAAAGDHDEAVAVLLDAVREPTTRDEGREALLEVFTLLGPDHPLVREARPKLASALF